MAGEYLGSGNNERWSDCPRLQSLLLECYFSCRNNLKMFHLIEFLINKTVAVVPQKWCSDGVVYWPNYRNDERVNRAVKNSEDPGPDWETHDVRVIKSCDDYFEARRLLKKSLMCNTSDLQSEEEEEDNRPKRRPKPIHFFGDSDNESEEEGHHKKRARGSAKNLNKPVLQTAPVIPPPPFMPTSTAAPPPPTSPPEQQTPSTSQVYRPTWRGGRCGSDSISCSAAEVHIMSLLELMKHQQEQIIAKINYLTSKLNQAGEDMEMPENPVKFPLSSMEDLDNFEEWLKNSSNNRMKLSLISSLASIGGHDTKRVTWNILSHMFHDDVGRRINWKGINGKRSFKELESQRFILCAVRKNPVCRAATEDEIMKHAIRWFNLAADRGNARIRLSLNK